MEPRESQKRARGAWDGPWGHSPTYQPESPSRGEPLPSHAEGAAQAAKPRTRWEEAGGRFLQISFREKVLPSRVSSGQPSLQLCPELRLPGLLPQSCPAAQARVPVSSSKALLPWAAGSVEWGLCVPAPQPERL